jgi:predicted oxidoreductase
MPKIKRWRVSRVFAVEHKWYVDAVNEEHALMALDDDTKTPSDEMKETWLGPVEGLDKDDLYDKAECDEQFDDSLQSKYGLWGEHPKHTRCDWREEAYSRHTQLGYWEWVTHRLEERKEEQ